ncbi:MAG: hypothetical protein IJ731_01425 [Eubacterium sp.]|nr:hypothetical protein [Eubacterium sp.]
MENSNNDFYMNIDDYYNSIPNQADGRGFDNSREIFKRQINCSFVLFLISVALAFLRIKLPFLPKWINTDFSAFPALIASIAYNPFIGAAMCLGKAIAHTLIHSDFLFFNIVSFLEESVFVLFAGFYYSKIVFIKMSFSSNEEIKQRRKAIIFFGSLIGTSISLVIHLVLSVAFSYSLSERFFGLNSPSALGTYSESLKNIVNITSLWQGILIIDLPVLLIKLLVISAAVSLIYPTISPFLHLRKK